MFFFKVLQVLFCENKYILLYNGISFLIDLFISFHTLKIFLRYVFLFSFLQLSFEPFLKSYSYIFNLQNRKCFKKHGTSSCNLIGKHFNVTF